MATLANNLDAKTTFVSGDTLVGLNSEDTAGGNDNGALFTPAFTWDANRLTVDRAMTLTPAAGQSIIVTGASTPTVDLLQWNPDGVTAGQAARITSSGEFSNNQGATTSEAFGAGASVSATKDDQVAIGNAASSGGSDTVVIGAAASVGAQNDVVIVGKSGTVSGTGGVAIGKGASAHSNAISIGKQAATTGANQFVVGTASFDITDMYLGGVTETVAAVRTYHAPNGSGTDVSGCDVALVGGNGAATNSNGGDVLLYGGALAGSGSHGNVLLAYTGSANQGFPVLPTYTDATRGAAGTAGRIIFNSDDGKLNIDDGTNWTLPDGTTT